MNNKTLKTDVELVEVIRKLLAKRTDRSSRLIRSTDFRQLRLLAGESIPPRVKRGGLISISVSRLEGLMPLIEREIARRVAEALES